MFQEKSYLAFCSEEVITEHKKLNEVSKNFLVSTMADIDLIHSVLSEQNPIVSCDEDYAGISQDDYAAACRQINATVRTLPNYEKILTARFRKAKTDRKTYLETGVYR